MNEGDWLEVWVRYTGEVDTHGRSYEPWTGLRSTWIELLRTDSLVVYEWTGNPRAVGDRTVQLVISVKT
jgi:hypothetical protein